MNIELIESVVRGMDAYIEGANVRGIALEAIERGKKFEGQEKAYQMATLIRKRLDEYRWRENEKVQRQKAA